MKRREFIKTAGIAGVSTGVALETPFFNKLQSDADIHNHENDILFFDTCVRIGRSRAPDPPGNWKDVDALLEVMVRHNIDSAAVEHAVAMEASPELGHNMLKEELGDNKKLWSAWNLMPHISPRIEKAVIDPNQIIHNRVCIGRVDAKDFCNGIGDKADFAPVLDACNEVRLPVFLDFRRQGDLATFDYGICERYPRIPFVIEGFTRYPLHRIVWCLQNYPNLYLSTVGFRLFNGTKFLCDEVGTERLIYGSNWPAQSMGMSQGMVLLAGINEEQRNAIAKGNFMKLISEIGMKGGKS